MPVTVLTVHRSDSAVEWVLEYLKCVNIIMGFNPFNEFP